jgi:hypothetical protein
MKAILSMALVLGVCCLAGAADKVDPVGTWKCEYEIGGQQRTSTLTIKKDGGKLAGTMSWPDQKETNLKDLQLKDGTLTFIDPTNKEHPSVQGFGPEFSYSADWTNHDRAVTGLPGVKVLFRVDEATYQPVRDYFKTRGGTPMGKDHPAAWLREYGGGRLFYTELGHDLRSLDTKFGRKHVTEGVRWAAGK